jgi:hypothetical protein
MKTKILLSITFFFCISLTSNAQIKKGDLLLGGTLNFTSQKDVYQFFYSAQHYKYLCSNIQIGMAVKNNTVVGLILFYSHSNIHDGNFPDSNYVKGDGYHAGIFYRKYKSLLKNFYFFEEIDAVYTHAKSLQGSMQAKSDLVKTISNGGNILIVPGLSYQICKRFQMELSIPNIFSIYYLSYKLTYNTPPSPNASPNANNFSVNASLNSNFLSNFGIGFKFFLDK